MSPQRSRPGVRAVNDTSHHSSGGVGLLTRPCLIGRTAIFRLRCKDTCRRTRRISTARPSITPSQLMPAIRVRRKRHIVIAWAAVKRSYVKMGASWVRSRRSRLIYRLGPGPSRRIMIAPAASEAPAMKVTAGRRSSTGCRRRHSRQTCWCRRPSRKFQRRCRAAAGARRPRWRPKAALETPIWNPHRAAPMTVIKTLWATASARSAPMRMTTPIPSWRCRLIRSARTPNG